MKLSRRNVGVVSLASLLLVALWGCSPTGPVAPILGEDGAPSTGSRPLPDTAPPPPSRLTGPSAAGNLGTPEPVLNWLMVVQRFVLPKAASHVAGSRYDLAFPLDAVEEPELVTIKEHDPDIVDVTLGPHGIKFGKPVTLTIDFRGTQADPKAPKWDGREPVLYWLNEDTKCWEEVPGRTDWTKCRHIVQLEHFSRYVLGGKAGWKGQPPREPE